jgi:hypothetical protein
MSVAPDQTLQVAYTGPQDHARRGLVLVAVNTPTVQYQAADSARIFRAAPIRVTNSPVPLLAANRFAEGAGSLKKTPWHNHRFAGVVMDHHASLSADPKGGEGCVTGRIATQIYGLSSIYYPCPKEEKVNVHVGDKLCIKFVTEDGDDYQQPLALTVVRGGAEIASVPGGFGSAMSGHTHAAVLPIGVITKVNYFESNELQVLLEPFGDFI